MLQSPSHHQHPFPFFLCDAAFSPEQCLAFEQLFLKPTAWQAHDNALYRCAMRVVTDEIAPDFRQTLIARMRDITGLPLTDHLLVTAQRMMPGQIIGTHSDRPFLGYEMARLIVQLNPSWKASDGGILELLASPEGQVELAVPPEHNTAMGFTLHEDSWHRVTHASAMRQTLVFNFWHAANTPALAKHVETLFANIDFSTWPAELGAIASVAESELPEDISFRAGTAATALQRWGYDALTMVHGYQYSAGLGVNPGIDDETRAAVLLADWVARLHRESFELAHWQRLHDALKGSPVFPRLQAIWPLCLPKSCASA